MNKIEAFQHVKLMAENPIYNLNDYDRECLQEVIKLANTGLYFQTSQGERNRLDEEIKRQNEAQREALQKQGKKA